jgi:hypothetical protein
MLGGKDCLCEDIPLFVIGGGSNYWLAQVSYRDHLGRVPRSVALFVTLTVCG